MVICLQKFPWTFCLFRLAKAYIDGRQPTSSSDLPAQLKRLHTYVMDVNTDSLDNQLQAEDLLSTNNFVAQDEGLHWRFDIPSEPAPVDPHVGNLGYDGPGYPSRRDVAKIKFLNGMQQELDCRLRDMRSLRRLLFDTYWTFV